jgi:hypothetical protein
MLDVSTHNQEKIKEYLTEIIMKLGPYKRDNYEHAVSVMNNSTKKAVLDGVKVHHLGNALDRERIESKMKYYTLRGDAKVYESQILEGEFEGDMVVEKYVEPQPKSLTGHPLYEKELVEITQTKPSYRLRWIE